MAALPEDVGVFQNQMAVRHRAQAYEALRADEEGAALVEALLALEARIEELTCYVARLG